MTKELQLVNSDRVCLVDDDDYNWLSRWSWYLDKEGYAKHSFYNSGRGKNWKKPIRMHKLVTHFAYPIVDHINRNKLDNRKINLRKATPLENVGNMGLSSRNTSGYKGVSLVKKSGSWRAYIKKSRNQVNLGFYKTKEDAALAYNKAAKEYFGDYAYVNEIK